MIAMVTGAGTGIGRAIALALVAQGHRTALIGRTKENLQATAALAEAGPGETLVAPADVSDEAAITAIVRQLCDRWGRIDVLVNNAGANIPRRTIEETDQQAWHSVVDANMTGIYVCTRAVLPIMRRQKSGHIVNVASDAGRRASLKAGAAYSAAKHGALSLTESINLEASDDGIRATSILPGDVNTPILDRRTNPPPPEDRALMVQSEDVAAAVMFVIGLPARANVEELIIRPSRRLG
jgi:NADP-dependent 3-hydroxy acid dehydrogenase YdfG